MSCTGNENEDKRQQRDMALMKHQAEATIMRVKRSMASRITLFP